MKATKKLIGASAALVAALAVSVGSTFAWFTTQNKADIKNISATVTTSDSSLEMKLVTAAGEDISGQNWGYALDLTDFFEAVKLDALTYDAEKGGLITFGADAKETTTAGADGKATSGKFVEFYIAFRSQSELKIYLTSESTVTTDSAGTRDTINAWDELSSAEYGEEIHAGNPITAKAENAVRVGFATTNTKGGEFTGKGTWDPHPSAGYSRGSKNLAQEYEAYITGVSSSTLNDKYDDSVYETQVTANGKSNTSAMIAQTNSATVADGSINYHYAYVHIAMWIEGTDADCFNNIFGDKVTLELHFEAEEVTD